MPLVQLVDLSIAYGDNKLLDGANLALEAGRRVGLLGRNGEGKSTLIKLVAGEIQPDDGQIRTEPGVTVAALEQTAGATADTTVYDFIATGLGDAGALIAEYQALSADPDLVGETLLAKLTPLQGKLDACDGWNLQRRVDKVINRLSLPGDAQLSALSGGWQRRASLARALVSEPDVLLLDEPTNHLDIDAIVWLERQVANFRGAVLFVTHDREFLRNLATDIVDLERGKLTLWPGNYDDYLRRKAAAIEAEAQQNRAFDKKLAAEEVWIRKGIQARRTRNEGRVRALKKMRSQRAERIARKGNVRLALDQGASSGKMVIEAERIGFDYGGDPVVRDFSIRILRGDRIGLVGPNGVGKTTLLKLLLGEIAPLEGQVRHGTRLEIAYFDQLRRDFDPEARVIDVIGEGREEITVNGKPRHIISYLSDFLFTPARARSPVGSLSGGERSRVLLARLFSRPANLLVMDEPTNDLDIETLELLEELLMDYDGTLLLVSHDRRFMDNVVTGVIAFEGDGRLREFVGGYSDWQRQQTEEPSTATRKTSKPAAPQPVAKTAPSRKLSYNEQRELAALPDRIEALESEIETLNTRIAAADFYRQDAAAVAETMALLKTRGEELDACFERWSELEGN